MILNPKTSRGCAVWTNDSHEELHNATSWNPYHGCKRRRPCPLSVGCAWRTSSIRHKSRSCRVSTHSTPSVSRSGLLSAKTRVLSVQRRLRKRRWNKPQESVRVRGLGARQRTKTGLTAQHEHLDCYLKIRDAEVLMAFRACGCHPTKGFVLTHAVELLGMGDRSRKRHSLSRGFRLVACSCGHLAFFGIEFVLRCGSNSQVELQVQSGSRTFVWAGAECCRRDRVGGFWWFHSRTLTF